MARSEVTTGRGTGNGAPALNPSQANLSNESFEQVFRREALAMVRVAYLMVDDKSLAEEIVQDAFAKLYACWESTGDPGAYLRACVINGCRSAYRRRAIERKAAARAPLPASIDLEVDHMGDALAALPAKRRAAIVLRYYDGLSEAEIAKVLRVRPGTVKSLVHRGLAQLREVIER